MKIRKISLLNKIQKFVIDLLKKTDNQNDIRHAERTAYWVKELKPDADEAMLIAAFSHDIERAVYGDWKKGSDEPDALKKHQDQSAEEIGKFLAREGADEKMIERVKSLVSNHEEGGDADQNIICDADALSFFEDKAVRRVRKWKEEGRSKEEMKKNMDFYFSRLKSPRAKEIAGEWYEMALDEIEK